jgi:hypothetical protein
VNTQAKKRDEEMIAECLRIYERARAKIAPYKPLMAQRYERIDALKKFAALLNQQWNEIHRTKLAGGPKQYCDSLQATIDALHRSATDELVDHHEKLAAMMDEIADYSKDLRKMGAYLKAQGVELPE